MFITMPIARIEFTDNTLRINENSFHYNISNSFDIELLESLISKGAYGSALLYLNNTSILESINETKVAEKEFKKYLQECKNLLKENVYELEASNLRPLCSIRGLEILESDTNIYRGKTKLFVEDFRGVADVAKSIDDFITAGNSDDLKDRYINLLNDISEKENSNKITKADYADAIKRVHRAYTEIRRGDFNESAEGTQTTDIASRKDQNLGGKVVMPPKKKRIDESIFNVGTNHKFKGFILSPNGRYERGNFVLVKEGEQVKAVHKNSL